MIKWRFWLKQIEGLRRQRPVLWLSGVRRAGKTYLSQSITGTEYFDCELPRVRALLQDAEGFSRQRQGRRIVLDEIHRPDNPSELLKIAADRYPRVKIPATCSSSLGASVKFRSFLNC